jgi:flagellar FliJ protein
MKPFSLETVLDYRKRLEDIAKNRLFEAQTAKRMVQERLAAEEQAYTELIETLDRRQFEGIDILDLIRYVDQIQFSQNRIVAIKKTLAEKNARVVEEREQLILRSKERKIMEKLREKQNQAWREHLNKKEAALLDEIAIIFHDK